MFAGTQSRAESTIYVGKHFEVRNHDAPVKYVFNDNTRVARVTGSLSANERLQRLRLRAGWNLVSLAVTAPDFPGQLQEFTSGPVPVIQALYRWQPATSDYGAITSGESVPVGTVLWLSAQVDVIVPVRGGYMDPTEWRASASGTFVAVPALEAQPLRLPAGVTVWRYDAPNRRWQAGLTGDLASVSDLPSTLAPGEAIYIHSNEPADLGAPAPEERIRYYHQDHLGSSSVMTDAAGALVEETAFYPFGIPRNEHRLRAVDESYKFTQKERDRESGLHYFEARYLGARLARFASADPKYVNPDTLAPEEFANPQLLNLYAYALNNPLKLIDPQGKSPRGVVNAPPDQPAPPSNPNPQTYPSSRSPAPAPKTAPGPSPAPQTPVRPPAPAPRVPLSRPPVPLEFPLSFEPNVRPPVMPNGGGTSVPEPPKPPSGLGRAGGIFVPLAIGYAVGTAINGKLDISGRASNMGVRAEAWAEDQGAGRLSGVVGGIATLAAATPGPASLVVMWLLDDDDDD